MLFSNNFSNNQRIKINNYGSYVCWRIGSTGPYDCTTVVTCTGGGAPCSASISITVDQETCSTETFEGYVQATCEDVGSLSGRVPFSSIFTPTPTCAGYQITCNAVAVESISMTILGTGYDPLSPPAVSFSGGGGGTGAVANAIVGDGGIKTKTISNGGTGYDGGGSATFLAVPAVTLTGIGTGAIFDVTVAVGIITVVTLNSSNLAPGSGYAINDTFNFSPADVGGTGSGAIITVNTLNTGEVQYINLSAGGSDYTVAPIVTIGLSPSGTNATASAVMAPCPPLDYGTDCDGNSRATIDNIELGQVFNACYTGTPPSLASGFIINEVGCCYDCVTVTITKPDSPTQTATLTYIDCTTLETVTQVISESASISVCMVNDSWLVTEDTGTTSVVVGGSCP